MSSNKCLYIHNSYRNLRGDSMAFEIWMLTILKIVAVIIGGHLAITKMLPILKNVLTSFIKKTELITSTISILLFFIGVLVLKFIISFLVLTENKYLAYANVLLPGIEVILTIIPYVLYFLIAAIIVAGLKK